MQNVVWLRSQDGLDLLAAIALTVEERKGKALLYALMPSGTEWDIGTFPTLAAAQDELDHIEWLITVASGFIYRVGSWQKTQAEADHA